MDDYELVALSPGWQGRADTLILYARRRRDVVAVLPAALVVAILLHHLDGATLTAEVAVHIRNPLTPTPHAGVTMPRLPGARGRRLRGHAP